MGLGRAACVRIERGLATIRGRSERSNPTKESLALDITAVLFVLLAVGVVGGGLAVVTLRNVIHSAIAMMVCFGSLAGMYLLLGAGIIAAAQVLIYLGAISVLILFAIMLTQTKSAPSQLVFQTQAVPAAFAAVLLAIVTILSIVATDWGEVADRIHTATQELATVLFASWVLPFEIVGVLLLAAVVGGVFLAKREQRDGGPG